VKRPLPQYLRVVPPPSDPDPTAVDVDALVRSFNLDAMELESGFDRETAARLLGYTKTTPTETTPC
jgi:hypothetical protein